MSRSKFACMVAAVAVGLASLVARAQDVVNQAGPFAMPVSNRSVERFAAVLKLDAEQKATARTLYQGYRAQFKSAAEAGNAQVKALTDKLQEGGNQDFGSFAKDQVRITKVFVEKAGKLEKEFFEDLKAILTAEQSAIFERAERARRREVGLKFSFIAGEGVDVFQILHDLKIDRDANPELKQELDHYELEVDRAMVAKDKMFRGVFDLMEKLEGPESDPALMEKTLKEFFDSGTSAREMHRSFIRKLTPLLPQDKQEAFDAAVKKASFPRVYFESAGAKAIKAVQELADLSGDQKTEVAAIAESFRRDADAANTRWAAAIEDKQSKMAGKFMEFMGGDEEKPDDPLRQAREARKAVDERTIAKLGQVLKAEQREKLPDISQDEGYRGNEYMPDFDENDVWEEWKKEDGVESPPTGGPKHEKGGG